MTRTCVLSTFDCSVDFRCQLRQHRASRREQFSRASSKFGEEKRGGGPTAKARVRRMGKDGFRGSLLHHLVNVPSSSTAMLLAVLIQMMMMVALAHRLAPLSVIVSHLLRFNSRPHDESWLPEKRILEIILDTLQRKDTYDIFAEPVDPSEVEEYYEFITEPMDFGTMRAKLHEGLYKNLQQFEHDMYLIFENAMYFNSSGTVYFRQARALEELAKKVFHVLKTDPEKFELEFNATRRRSSRKVDCEPPRGPTLCSGQKIARDSGSNSLSTDADKKGGRRQRRSHIPDIDRRCTYNPWKSDSDETDASILSLNLGAKTLIHANDDIGYRKSLLSFVKDLGPIAQRVAERKMQGLSRQPITNHDANSQIPSASFHFQTELNRPFGQSMEKKVAERKLQGLSTQSTTNHDANPQIPSASSHFRTELNRPFSHPMEKTDVITMRQALDKGKSVKTFSPDANDSAKSRKGQSGLRDETDIHNKNGVVVMGLEANRDRSHRNPVKESKNSQVGKFDLNQAQPMPSGFNDEGLISRTTPSDISNLEHVPREALYKQQMHYMHPSFSRQFLFNVPLLDPWLNGRNRLPRVMHPGLDIGWSRPSMTSFGQASSSQGYTGRNEGLDINQSPSVQQKNRRLFNFEL